MLTPSALGLVVTRASTVHLAVIIHRARQQKGDEVAYMSDGQRMSEVLIREDQFDQLFC